MATARGEKTCESTRKYWNRLNHATVGTRENFTVTILTNTIYRANGWIYTCTYFIKYLKKQTAILTYYDRISASISDVLWHAVLDNISIAARDRVFNIKEIIVSLPTMRNTAARFAINKRQVHMRIGNCLFLLITEWTKETRNPSK